MAEPKIVFDVVAHAAGAGEIDKLAASLQTLDKAVDPQAAARAQELAAELQRLGEQQQAVVRFQELGAAVAKAKADMVAAEAAVAALRAEIDASGAPTTAQAGRLEKLGAAAQSARGDLQAQTAALDASAGRLAALGVDTQSLAKTESELAAATRATRTELQALGQSLQGVHARELVDELRQLGQQQQAIAQLRDLEAVVDKTRTALTVAESAAAAYAAKLTGIEAPTAAQVNTQQRLAFAVDDAKAKLAQQTAAAAAAGGKLAALGVETSDLAGAEERLRTAAQGTLTQIEALGRQQAALSATSRETEARTTALAEHLKGLQSGFRDAGGTADAMGQHLEAAFRTLGIKSVQQVTAEIDRLKAALVAVRSVDPFSADTQRAAAAMQQKVQALEAELNQVPGAAERAGTGIAHVGQASTGISASLEAATLKAVSLGAALLGIGSAGQLASGVLQTASEFETLRLRLEQLLGSTTAATTAFDQIKQLAISTPFEVKDLAAAFIELSNFGLKPTQTQMLALADTAAVAGGGTEALQRITLALGQAWAKTKLQGDEILQLTEAGVPVWDLLAKATGKNVVELQQLSKDGALGRDVIIKLFEAIGESNAGASVKLMSTFSGTVSNAKDAIADFFDLIGKSGALDYLTKKLTEALDEFQKLKDTGELERKAKAISDAFIKFAQGAELAFDAVRKLSGVLELLEAAWAGEKVIALTASLLGVQKAATVAAVATTELAAVQRAAAASAAAASTAVAATGAGAALAAGGVRLLGVAMSVVRSLSLAGLVLGVAELAGKFFEAKKAAEDGDEAVRKMLAGPPEDAQKAKVAIRDVVAELDDFKKGLPNLEGDIAGLTGEGLAAVANSTIENLRAIKASGVDMGNAITVVAERAAQSLGIELPSQAAKSSEAFKGVKAEADLLIGQLPNLGLSAEAAGNVVSQALSRMVDAASTQRDFDQISASIKLMAAAGRIGPGAVEELLTRVRDRAQEVKDKIESATPGIQGLREAAIKAGVDVGLLTTGVSEGFAKGVKQVTDLAEQVRKTGTDAAIAGPQLKAAIDQRITAASTKQELELVGKAVEGIGAKSPGMGALVVAALDKIKAKTEDVKNAADGVGDAWKRLGVDISKSSETSSTQLIKDYEKAKESGTGTAEELQVAFVKMAEAVIAANNGTEPSWLKVEAAARGLTRVTDEFGTTAVKSLGKAKKAADDLARSFSSVYEQATKARNASVNSVLGSNTYDADKFATDSSGQRISIDTAVPSGYTLDQDAFNRAQDAFLRGGGYPLKAPDPKNFLRPVPKAPAPKPAPAPVPVTAPAPVAAPAPARAPSPAPAPTPAAQPTVTPSTYQINVTIGDKRHVIGATSKSSADAMIAALEDAYKAAGSG